MVKFVSVQNIVDLIQANGLEPFLQRLADYVEADFRRWGLFDKAPRVAAHSRDGVIELMPASDGNSYSFKYVNGHPKNPLMGLQTVTAFGVLADVDTGYPQMLSEMTIATALRTAVTSALAAKYLARPDAETMAIIGLGAQSEFQALAFSALLGVKKLRVFDTDAEATAKFKTNVGWLDLDIAYAASTEEAVLGADIITTITADKQNATILSDNMVGAGVHINAVGGDCPGKTELQRDILLRGDVFVEFPEQTRIEGEIQQMEPDFPVTELWQVITGQAAGRKSRDQITIFDSVGFAVEDFSTLRLVHDCIQGTPFYTDIDLIVAPDDPRNLFGLLAPVAGQGAGEGFHP
ncbi:ornithine cyclodeaminase [Mesorhizobium loti]|nr:ornithine cyclodeaminase [Mesorhizobium loti]PLP58030.1 ornithine cyclodeaminase [Mesorhizobium loti]